MPIGRNKQVAVRYIQVQRVVVSLVIGDKQSCLQVVATEDEEEETKLECQKM